MIRLLKTSEDYQAALNFLEGYTETSLFLLSNLSKYGLNHGASDFHGTYLGNFAANNQLTGLLSFTNSGILLHQCPSEATLLKLLEKMMPHFKRPISGIVGEAVQNAVLRQKLSDQLTPAQLLSHENLYQLNLTDLEAPKLTSNISLVPAKDVPEPILIQWIIDYNAEALGAENTETNIAMARHRVHRAFQNDSWWVLLKEKTPVSLCGCNASYKEYAQIGPVWTPPEARNKGYARQAVYQFLKQGSDAGTFQKSLLFTDNPAAQKAYEAIGFKQTGHFCLSLYQTN